MGIHHNLSFSGLPGNFGIMPHPVLAMVVVPVQKPSCITGLESVDAPFCGIVKILFQLGLIPCNLSGGLVMNDVVHAFFTGACKHGVKVKVRGGLGKIKVVVGICHCPAIIPAFKENCVNVVSRSKVDVLLCSFRCCPVTIILSPGIQSKVHPPPYANIFGGFYPRDILNGTGLIQV